MGLRVSVHFGLQLELVVFVSILKFVLEPNFEVFVSILVFVLEPLA